jgi:hypothetical protein
LLPFGPEPSVFSSAVKKLKNWNIQDDNFACGPVWVRNLVFEREEHRLRVLEFSSLRRIFGPMKDEATGEWRKLLRDLYSSPSIIRIIKSRRMRWAGHVARMGRKRNAWESQRERDH